MICFEILQNSILCSVSSDFFGILINNVLTLGEHTNFVNQEEHSGLIWPFVLFDFIPF